MKLTRINAEHWQLTATARTKVATIGRASTAGQLNAIASVIGITCQELGQVITVICARDPHRIARIYGIHYDDRRTADLADLLRAIRLAQARSSDTN